MPFTCTADAAETCSTWLNLFSQYIVSASVVDPLNFRSCGTLPAAYMKRVLLSFQRHAVPVRAWYPPHRRRHVQGSRQGLSDVGCLPRRRLAFLALNRIRRHPAIGHVGRCGVTTYAVHRGLAPRALEQRRVQLVHKAVVALRVPIMVARFRSWRILLRSIDNFEDALGG